jgi:phosphoribosylanthranilate isomerase
MMARRQSRATQVEGGVLMFRIKICGVTTTHDALAAAAAGADAIGLNFCPESARCIDLATARRIVEAVPPHIAKVGVFVNEPAERVIATADELVLDFIQLHGDEPPNQLADLAPRRVIRAFRLCGDVEPLVDYLQKCRELGHSPDAVLIDAYAPGAYGGTGVIANWGNVRSCQRHVGAVPVVLAGGLTPENVAEAIGQVRPAAVDVASGVELAPGQKDVVRMRGFVVAARRAWQDVAFA